MYQQSKSDMPAKLLMKSLLLFISVFALVAPVFWPALAPFTRAAVILPSVAVPLAIAVTSFN